MKNTIKSMTISTIYKMEVLQQSDCFDKLTQFEKDTFFAILTTQIELLYVIGEEELGDNYVANFTENKRTK